MKILMFLWFILLPHASRGNTINSVTLTGKLRSDPESTQNLDRVRDCKNSLHFPLYRPQTFRNEMEKLVSNISPTDWHHLIYNKVFREWVFEKNTMRTFEAKLMNCSRTSSGTFECDLGLYKNNIYSIYAVPDHPCYSVIVDGDDRRMQQKTILKQIYLYANWKAPPKSFQLTCQPATANLKLFVMKITCDTH